VHTLVMILLFLGLFLIAPKVAAYAQQRACCQETLNGDSCVYTEISNCDTSSGKFAVPTTCEETSYCQIGCCVDAQKGICYKNAPQATCENQGGTWRPQSECQVSECTRGCCIVGTESFFVTQTQCRREASNFPNAEISFDETITTEQACIDKSRSQDKGACVIPDGTCQFTTRETCNAQEQEGELGGNVTRTVRVGFHKDTLCSNQELGTECAPQQRTGCFEEDVYWFDSCGNPENIYDANKERAYNGGFVLQQERSCQGGVNDPSCGNCNYAQGTLCKKAPRSITPAFGEYICQSIDCQTTLDDDSSPSSGGTKKNGESWCLYDGDVGQGKDLVGSRHFRNTCINGEEIIEPCRDFREEICVQGVLGQDILGTQESFKARGEYVEAACRDNRWETCQTCNDVKTCGSECDQFSGAEKTACCARKCCENNAQRDCSWLEAGIITTPNTDEDGNAVIPANAGVCVPQVPPGLAFWSGETQQNTNQQSQREGVPSAIQRTPTTNAESACDIGNKECTVTFKKKGAVTRIFAGDDWECVNNCQCITKDWVVAGNNYCKSLGDCGAYYNIAGDITLDGYGNTASEERNFFHGYALTREDIGDFDTLSTISDEDYTKAGFVRRLGVSGAIGFGGLTATTLVAAFAGKQVGGLVATAVTGSVAGGSPAILAPVGGFSALFNPFAGVGLNPIGFIGPAFIAISIASIINAATEQVKEVTYAVQCSAWQAPTGGNKCELCNEGNLPCSEYRCKSLGQLCGLINQGTSEERCVNLNPNDVNSPIISPAPEDLARGLTLREVTEQGNKGYQINERIEPFSPITIGINTNEPAQCKYDTNHSIRFEDMMNRYFGASAFSYNHTTALGITSELVAEDALRITNGGVNTIYIRCQDATGNKNERDYFIKFRVKPGPDLTAPKIERTSIQNGAFIPHGTEEAPLSIYVNEPSLCRWSRADKPYNDLEEEFNCARSSFATSPSLRGLYECQTTLTRLIEDENEFFFKCQDKPSAPEDQRNTNEEAFEFTIIGTLSLTIKEISPSGTLFVNNLTLTVETGGGSGNGQAICGYGGEDTIFESMAPFKNTGQSIHTQTFETLQTGRYAFNVKCRDDAGNEADGQTTVNVRVDLDAPIITGIYLENNKQILHIQTSEDAICEYAATDNFRFGEGTPMIDEGKEHQANWAGEPYTVRCQDVFGNERTIKVQPAQ